MRSIFHNKTILTLSAALVLIIVAYLWLTSPLPAPKENVLSDSNYYIAHAGGAIDGKTYLNCEEALLQSLQNGYKYVELDLGLTSDSVLVCLHDWADFNKKATNNDTADIDRPLSKEEFLQRKIQGKYTPMTLERVTEIRKHHPFTLVTDKISNTETLNRFFSNGRDQLMVEAFKLSDYANLKLAGYVPMMSLSSFNYSILFKVFIYYPINYHGKIDWICVHSTSDMKSLRMVKRLFGCKVAMFTSNSPSFFEEHLGREIDLLYTDNWNFNTKTNNDSVNCTTY